jgi:AraC-like DNA-binding protein
MDTFFSSINAQVVVARFGRLGRAWCDSEYSDNVSRLYWITAGRGRVRHHGRDFDLRPGGLYLIPSGTLFSYACEKRLDQHWVHFTATLPGGLPLLEHLPVEYEVRPKDAPAISRRIARLEALVPRDGLAEEFEKRGLLFQLLALFLASAQAVTVTRRRSALVRFRTALQYVEDHLAEPLPVGEMARVCHLERSYFSRTFQQHMGIGPANYIMRRRIERAKQQLWTTEEPLRALAESLGFADAFHFSKSFKRLTGMSPRDFRAMRSSRAHAGDRA